MAIVIVALVAGVAVLVTLNQMNTVGNPGGRNILNSSQPETTNLSTTTITTLSPNPGGSSTIASGSACSANGVCPPCPLDTTCESLTYANNGRDTTTSFPVKVNYVEATEFVCNNCGAVNGQSYIMFAMNFENTGSSPIYIQAGTGGLNASTFSPSVLQAVPSERCAGTTTIVALEEGQNYTMYAPGCNTGFDYQVTQAGTALVTLFFQWTVSSQASTFPDATMVEAHFSFA